MIAGQGTKKERQMAFACNTKNQQQLMLPVKNVI